MARRDGLRYRPDMTGIVIVGAGFGGIGMAIGLKKAGFHDFVILEKSDDLGGTWHHNQYPGCACDVPSPLYSYSFELNPAWSRLFAPQQEIWEYLRMCARKYGVDEHIRYGRTVERMDWDDEARRWDITTSQNSGAGRGGKLPGAGRGIGGRRAAPALLPRHSGCRPVRRTSLPLGAVGSFARPGRQAGRGDRDRRVGDPVHPRDRQAGAAPRRVPAHPAVGPSPAGRADPGPAARHVRGLPGDRPDVARRHLPGDGSQGARFRCPPEADGPAGADGQAAHRASDHRPGAASQPHPGLHHRLQADPAGPRFTTTATTRSCTCWPVTASCTYPAPRPRSGREPRSTCLHTSRTAWRTPARSRLRLLGVFYPAGSPAAKQETRDA
jgi:hypothetical protein